MPQVGYVYIVHAKGTNYIKVGKSTNVLKRLQHLQHGVPFPLVLLSAKLVQDMDIAEQRLKAFYRPYLARGEWYQVPDDILKRWPSDKEIAPLTVFPAVQSVGKDEAFSSLTALQIRGLLEDSDALSVKSLYEALECDTQTARIRIRVCLSRLCAADIIARDSRGKYSIKKTEETLENEITANDAAF